MPIENNPTILNNELVNMVRSQIEQRAEWFFLINDEAEKLGYDWEAYCRPAIFRCGCLRGEEMLSKIKDRTDLIELGEYFRDNSMAKVFEREMVKISQDEMIQHFHYCPLVAGWKKLTNNETLIAKMCNVAMDGDRGIFSRIPDVDFILEETIADGKPFCRLILRKREGIKKP